MALFMAGSGGATLAYAFPRFKEGEFGGKFVVGKVEEFEDGAVTSVRTGKFFVVRQGDEFRALYQVCTHLGCLVRETDDGFSCPCHGEDASGGSLGPTLISAKVAAKDDDFFRDAIANGRPGSAMPPWSSVLSTQNIEDVIAFLRSKQ